MRPSAHHLGRKVHVKGSSLNRAKNILDPAVAASDPATFLVEAEADLGLTGWSFEVRRDTAPIEISAVGFRNKMRSHR